MTRKLSVLFILAFFVMSLCSVAFAAKAKTADLNSPLVKSHLLSKAKAAPRIVLSDDAVGGTETFGKPETAEPSALGYYMLGAVTIGYSAFDWQSNEAQQRQIVMGSDNMGNNNRVHNVFMYRPPSSTDRTVRYAAFKLGSGVAPVPSNISPITGGYGSISLNPSDSFAIAAYHWTRPSDDTRSRTQIGRQGVPGSSAFQMYNYPSNDSMMPNILTCQGIKTGMGTQDGGYIWPHIAGDLNLAGTAQIAHVLALEYTGAAGTPYRDTTGKRSLVYFKTRDNAAAPTATCGFLLDSMGSAISYDIAASRVSNKVAAVYQKPRSWTGYDLGDDDDVVYRESQDLGETWGAVTKITNYSDSEEWLSSNGRLYRMRAHEVSALYDDEDYLHVLIQTYWADPATHYYLVIPSRIYHWSSRNATCLTMLVDGFFTWGSEDCNTPYGQQIVSKVSLTQCNVGGEKRLYAVYTGYYDSTGMLPPYPNTYSDCSDELPLANGKIANGDIAIQGSTDLTGEFWGIPVNATKTQSDNCAVGSCFAEQFTNTPPYVGDSLRIQYMLDKDAGSFVQNAAGGSSFPQGEEYLSPMAVMSYPCYSISLEAMLAVSPTSIVWPFHTTPGGTNEVEVTLTNTGNTNGDYARNISYEPLGTWLAFKKPENSTVTAGCVQEQVDTVTATGPGSEGLYKATVTWNYTGGKTLEMAVELYNSTADHWFVEDYNALRTSTVQMTTTQTSRAAAQRPGRGFKYFSDKGDTAYLYDGSLILGTSDADMSMGIFSDSAGVIGHKDTRIGRLLCLSNMDFDSVPDPLPQSWGYRQSYGTGCTRDSAIAFDVIFYAPRHIDSTNFMVGKFSMFAGPKNPSATINNVTVCYAADWDVPDDSSDNTSGYDATKQMVWQRGAYGKDTTRFGALAGVRDDGVALDGGMVLSNKGWVYRMRGYVADSIFEKIQATAGYTAADTIADLNSILVFAKNATIKPKARASDLFTIWVIFAGQPRAGGSLDELTDQICKAKAFIRTYLNSSIVPCPPCTNCGDANSDATVDISDAVYLISHIFTGGPPPKRCVYAKGKGDANGDGTVDISDAVYLISRIFTGGPPPHCQGM